MKFLLIFLLILFGCNKDLSPLNSTVTVYGSSSTPQACVPPVYMFDDFEAIPIGYLWTGGPSLITSTRSSNISHSCLYSWKLDVGPGITWGHWAGLNGSSLSGGLPISFPGATKIKMWVNVNQNIKIVLHWKEGYTFGANGEDWAYQINLIGSSAWQQIEMPLSSFSGGISIQPESVRSIWIDWNVPSFSAYPSHTIYIDDVSFEI